MSRVSIIDKWFLTGYFYKHFWAGGQGVIEFRTELSAEELVKKLSEELSVAFEPVKIGYVGFVNGYPIAVIDRDGYRLVILTGFSTERAVKLGVAVRATGVVKSRKFTFLEFVDEQWKHLSPATREKLLEFFRRENVELQGTRIMEEEVMKCLGKLVMTPGRGEDLQKLLRHGRKAFPEIARLLARILRYQNLKEVGNGGQ